MSPYEFRYKVDDQTVAQLCERNLADQVILHQVEQAVKLYLSNKSYAQLYRMAREEDENFPHCLCGDPDFKKKEDLLRFVLDMIHMEYDIPDGYIASEVDAMRVEPLKDGEITSYLVY